MTTDTQHTITTLERQLESARATIESQAKELESAHGKAWEIEKLVISLGNSLKGGN
jgi:hypothetical protein